jgi:MFS family permease
MRWPVESTFDNARTFYLMRFIFGAAEAGFGPGIMLYLTYWFTADERARWMGVYFAATPLALVIGGPISGFILDTLDGAMALGGWQWLFIVEGVPSVLVGLWALRHLTDKPIKAAWLDPDERVALQQGSIMSAKVVKRSGTISWQKLLPIPAFLVLA